MSETEQKKGAVVDKPEVFEVEEEPAANGNGPDVTVESESDTEAKPNGKRRRVFLIGGAALVVAAIAGLAYWLYSRQFESTDDAFVEADIVQVSPKVAAYVSKIHVSNNQFVHKGDLLVELDPKDFELRLEQAKAQLAQAQSQHGLAQANVNLTEKTTKASQTTAHSNVTTAQTNVAQTSAAADARKAMVAQAQAVARTAQASLAQTKAQVPQAESNVRLAETEYKRRVNLFDRGDISKQALDQGLNALQNAQAQLDAAQKAVLAAQSRVDEANAGVTTAQENYRQAVAQIDLTRSQVDESKGRLIDADAAPERLDVSNAQADAAESQVGAAQAAVDQAQRDLDYTKIYAPEDGYVTQKAIEEGQLVQVGAPLMALSLSGDVWVVANFKETQLESMKPGQSVEIKIDAYPNQKFHGKVDSIQAGTGSRFSVLPSENATGNYVKVVQRVPVKIVFDEKPDKLLAPGMSAEPVVKVR